MPTNDERIHALEQQHRERDENLTMLAGVIGSQGQDIKRLLQLAEQHSSLLTQQGEILSRIIGRLDGQTTVITQHTHLLNEHSRLLKTILERLPEQS